MEGIYFKNVPFRATEEELLVKISETLGGDCAGLRVRLFTSKDNQQKVAVASGFNEEISVVIRKLDNLRIGPYADHIKPKYDRGDARDDYGTLINPRPPAELRQLKQLNKISSRKITQVFEDNFFSGIKGVVNFQSSSFYCYLNGMNSWELQRGGKVLSVSSSHRYEEKHGYNFCVVHFKTVLDGIQSLSLFNMRDTGRGLVVFSNYRGQIVATTNRMKGIGESGSILNITDVVNHNGLIPFEKFDEQVVTKSKLQSLPSKCWKCFSASRPHEFDLIGISPDLDYLGGVCKCTFHVDLPVNHGDRPFKHGNEQFTRLTLSRMSSDPELIIMHDPMKKSYDGHARFREITAPILFDNWKTMSTIFKEKNKTVASIAAVEFIETIVEEKYSANVFYMEIVVPKSEFWNEDCVLAIRSLTVTMVVSYRSKGQVREEVRRVKLLKAVPEDEFNVKLITRVQVNKGVRPMVQRKVNLVPKPNKSEYETAVRSMNQLVSEKSTTSEIMSIIDPAKVVTCKAIGILKKVLFNKIGINRSYCQRIKESLNVEQRQGLQNAMSFALSVVQGPPGTGKTHVAAATAIVLGIKEEGSILVTSPSNYAADGLAVRIASISRDLKIPIKIIRIYAKSRETRFLRNNINPLEALGIPALHTEVKNDHDWLMGEEFNVIRNAMETNMIEKLPSDELTRLDLHKWKIEAAVLNGYSVLITTIGALADYRVKSWSEGGKISSVIVDEAGQVKTTDMPFLFSFKQKRTILFGDHMQLKPHVESLGASLAGLETSYMEWIDIGGPKVPWTLLLEQHRMNPGIRHLVSAVTYNNKLRDAESITARSNEIPASCYIGFPALKNHDILVYNHSFQETKVDGTSVENKGEAKSVAEVVMSLVSHGLQPSKITILTFYEAQKQLIKGLLKIPKIDVVNVDAFQGRENVLTIVCFSRSNEKFDIGFTKIMNRVNVAISRARFKMILFCDLKAFGLVASAGWKKMLSELNSYGSVVDI